MEADNSEVAEDSSRKRKYQLFKTIPAHSSSISALKFNPDNHLLASACSNGKLKLWNSNDGKFQKTLSGHSQGINDICWMKSRSNQTNANANQNFNTHLVSVSDDLTCQVWDIEAGKSIKTYKGFEDSVFCVAAFRNLIATGSFDRFIRVFDLRSGKVTSVLAHNDCISSIDFHPEGSLLMTSSFGGVIRIWEVSNLLCLKSICGEGAGVDNFVHEPAISYAKFSPNGKFVLTSNLKSEVKLWEYCQSKVIRKFSGHENTKFACSIDFAFDENEATRHNFIVSGSDRNKAYVWDVNTKELVQTLDAHNDSVVSVACNRKEGLIATGTLSKDRMIRLWKFT